MVRWSWFIAVFIAAIVILPVGCREKKTSGGYKFKQNVVEVDKLDDVKLVGIAGNEYTFSAPSPPAKVGDVIVGSEGQGYIRSVTDVIDNQDGTYTLITEQASLEHVIQEGEVEADFGEQTQPCCLTTSFSHSYHSCFSMDGSITTDLSLKPHLVIHYGWTGLHYFKFSVKGKISFRLAATVSISKHFSKDFEWRIPGLKYKIPGTIAGIPVVVTIKVLLCADVEARAAASVTTSYETSWSINAGVRYKHGSWKSFHHRRHTSDYESPSFDASASLSVRVYPKFIVKVAIAGVAGPAFHLSPYLEFDLTGKYPSSYHWALLLGLHGEMHVFVKIFCFTLADESFDLFDWSKVLKRGGSHHSTQFATMSLPDGRPGEIYSKLLFVQGGSPPYSFALSSGSLPSGLKLAQNGALFGVPTKSGSFSFEVTVTDSQGNSTSQNFTLEIVVTASGVCIPTESLPNAVQGQQYAACVCASGGQTPFFWEVVDGSLPPGTTAEQFGSDLWISGTPTTVGSYTFTVEVIDSSNPYQTATKEITIVVDANPGLQIKTSSLPVAIEGERYFAMLNATGGTPPYTWIFCGLPQGLDYNPTTGEIYGDVQSGLSGVYSLSVIVTDAKYKFASAQIDLTVRKQTGCTYYVSGNGDDSNSGLSWSEAFATISHALSIAQDGDTIVVADGTYCEHDLDFAGKRIHLKSQGGAANCVIDCQGAGRAFYFHSGETANSIVEGFTILNGDVTSVNGEGGAICCDFGSPTIRGCVFSGNAAARGGAINCEGSSPIIVNCLFYDNSATLGGAIYCCDYSSPTVTNCTFNGNGANDYGGAVACYSNSSPTLNNCVLWSDSAGSGGNEIHIYDDPSNPSYATLNYCCVDSTGYGGKTGNITENNCIHQDPQFVDAANGDLHLQSGSPCIDAGDNGYVPSGVTEDLDGNPRIVNGTVDIGAYEKQ